MHPLANDLSRLSAAASSFLRRQHRMWIGGQEVEAVSGERRDLIDPSSGEVIASVPQGSEADADAAVRAARAAFEGPWSRLKPHQREALMLKLADLVEAHTETIAQIESVNSGRLLINTRLFDAELSVYVLRYYAGWITKLHGKTLDLSVPYLPDVDFHGYTRREPVGVVAGIVPWNVAMCQAVWKIAPALAAGCTVVLKPADVTPLTALYLCQLAVEAGFPPGVINVVTGPGGRLGNALVHHSDVNKVSFTGSTEVGKRIGAAAGGQLKKVSLELGGKSPFVVLRDADVELAAPAAAWAIFGNHGQNCCAGSRLYVHRDHYDAIIDAVVKIAREIKLGPGLDPSSQMGPLVSRQQQQNVLRYIELGKRAGADVVVGGGAPEGPGCYVTPTVLTNVRQDAEVVQEEIFGPVLVATPFDSDEEALQLANNTQFGLGASIWSRNIDSVERFVRGFRAGTVWVNNHNVLDIALPFGGVKDSGLGHDLGEEALLGHTQIKAVVVRRG
jgi:phenylacetaldehyde dehydrogenase